MKKEQHRRQRKVRPSRPRMTGPLIGKGTCVGCGWHTTERSLKAEKNTGSGWSLSMIATRSKEIWARDTATAYRTSKVTKMNDHGYEGKEAILVDHAIPREVIRLEMTKDEATIVQNVIERYLDHLQVEIKYTDKREFQNALKQRERFLRQIVDRLNKEILEAS